MMHTVNLRTRRTHGFALVDAENQTIWDGRRLPAAAASAVFDEIDYYVAGLPTCAALTPTLLAAYVPLLASRGWALDLVAPGPDAADLALMERAHFAIDRGHTDLVVVSGDHIFAELANHTRLHVVTHTGRLSRALGAAATSITFLGSGTGAPLAA